MKGPFRADHVGSFLRPEALLSKRDEWKKDKITDAERRAEDNFIEEIVAKEEQFGLLSVTDGEFRRESFHFDFINEISAIKTNFTLKEPLRGEKKLNRVGIRPYP